MTSDRSKLRRAVATWVYDFEDGSREMRDLLGGKGANVAEMTRVLGAERVPAGFTITTEACVAYMRADRTEPEGMAEEVAAALQRLEAARRQAARRPGRSAAGVGPLGRARVDAGDARHGAQPRPERRVGAGARQGDRATSASPGTPTGGSCRCSATSRAACRASSSRRRSGRSSRSAASSSTPSSTRTRCKELTERFQSLYEFPQDPGEQLSQAIRAVFDSWTGERAVVLPAHQRDPGRRGAPRSTCSRWCSATRATRRRPAWRSAATR